MRSIECPLRLRSPVQAEMSEAKLLRAGSGPTRKPRRRVLIRDQFDTG